jgi:hypothetical protein
MKAKDYVAPEGGLVLGIPLQSVNTKSHRRRLQGPPEPEEERPELWAVRKVPMKDSERTITAYEPRSARIPGSRRAFLPLIQINTGANLARGALNRKVTQYNDQNRQTLAEHVGFMGAAAKSCL